jgi:hypothetical protein
MAIKTLKGLNKETILLSIILIFSFFLRIYRYNYPPLLWDEAALGYNAYSILHTARDEYGQFLLAITSQVSMSISPFLLSPFLV